VHERKLRKSPVALGIHKYPQDQLIPKIDCFKLKQALTVIP
jgi:hypothetical protein